MKTIRFRQVFKEHSKYDGNVWLSLFLDSKVYSKKTRGDDTTMIAIIYVPSYIQSNLSSNKETLVQRIGPNEG